jgi:uracil-DNA glycosylase family 4
MTNNEYVDFRLKNGSLCWACPLNGQRKVGCAGDVNSDIIILGEAPGKDEEDYNQQHQKHGVPFVGRSGWALKVKLLGPAGLTEIDDTGDGWPKVKKLKTFVFNTILCRPPKNKINSPEGKRAVACCSNSAKALVAHLLSLNPKRTLVPLGGTALGLLTGEDAISQYRGRVLTLQSGALEPMPEAEVTKIAMRGYKPPPELVPHLAVLKALLSKQRKIATMDEASRRALLEKQCQALAKPHLKFLQAMVKSCSKSTPRRKSSTLS